MFTNQENPPKGLLKKAFYRSDCIPIYEPRRGDNIGRDYRQGRKYNVTPTGFLRNHLNGYHNVTPTGLGMNGKNDFENDHEPRRGVILVEMVT